MNQLSVIELQGRGFTANPVGLTHFWRNILSKAGHSSFISSPGIPGISQVPYLQPVTEMLNLRAFGTSVAESPTVLPYSPPLSEGTCPRPPHQVCHSRATLLAQQGQGKARPYKATAASCSQQPLSFVLGHQLLHTCPRWAPEGSAQEVTPVKPAAVGLQEGSWEPSVPGPTAPAPHSTKHLLTATTSPFNTTWLYHRNKTISHRAR